ncbi:MAG: class I SAM-dependent methyltransferase [Acidimicrobiia bacterium]
MERAEGARTFAVSGDAYDNFMGRYSRLLAPAFADFAGVASGQRALDVGCGPGALTVELAKRLGPDSVSATDPSDSFVNACASRVAGTEVRLGRAEAIPFDDASFDVALAQLVLHFVSDAPKAAQEFRRVVRGSGVAGACVWDFERGMEMLRHFWDAALTVDPEAPDEARTLRFGKAGEIAELLSTAGFVDVTEAALDVATTYADFDELWSGFMAGIGPAGAFCVALDEPRRAALRRDLYERVGSPTGAFTLHAVARSAAGRAPA